MASKSKGRALKKLMKNFLKAINKKIDGLILTLVVNGIVLLMLGILVVWTDFVLRLVVGLVIIVIAYVFFYGAYRVWHFKKDILKYFK